MSNVKAIIYGFFFVIVVSIVVIQLRDHHSLEHKQADLFVLDALDINSKARDACHPIAQMKVGVNLEKNTSAQNEGTTKSTVIWKGLSDDGPFKLLVCKFDKNKGVVSLTADGKELLTVAAQ
jgi:hypothetical protein